MDVKLVVEQGAARSHTIRLRSEETVIGRRHGCDVRVPSASVSRRHCLLSWRDDYLSVEDLDSANGTYLNGERVAGRQAVRPGDRLEVGPVTFVVEYQLTQAAIDRLLRADEGEEFEEAFAVLKEEEAPVDEVPAPDTEPEKAPAEPVEPAEEEDGITIDFDGGERWQLPEGDELRNILSRLEEK